MASERRVNARSKAFGRFGMRIFTPQLMERPHHHGHLELNFVRGARLHYNMDGTSVTIEPDQLVMFWANAPHQLVNMDVLGEPELCNIYVPLDVFLMMPNLSKLQVELLNGAMFLCAKELCNWSQLQQWYGDYRAANSERLDILKLELNALFRRMNIQGLQYIKRAWLPSRKARQLPSSHIRQVVVMIQYVLDNLATPLTNAGVTSVVGLHPNYALNIFTKAMNIPLKQFILRMRLARARGFLLESDMAISRVAELSGFGSTSQFYAQFTNAYGVSPGKLRNRTVNSMAALGKPS